jgi:hypothetical protein
MSWVLVAIAAWVLVAAALAILIGRSVRHADEHAALIGTAPEPNIVIDEPAPAKSGTTGAARQRHNLPSARRPLTRPRSPFTETTAPGRPSHRG